MFSFQLLWFLSLVVSSTLFRVEFCHFDSLLVQVHFPLALFLTAFATDSWMWWNGNKLASQEILFRGSGVNAGPL
jgi:hypothetical protein